MAIEAVVRGVQLAVVEPLEERRVRLVEGFREGLRPLELLARVLRPEALEIRLGFLAHRLVGGHAGNVRLLHEFRRRWEDTRFGQYRLDGGRHGNSWRWKTRRRCRGRSRGFIAQGPRRASARGRGKP